jgi:hypothetical protein
MKATAATLLLAAALLSAACGEGRAIFNINVHSFIEGTGEDTIPYFIPPGTASASKFEQISLVPGLGSSIVESATLTGAADLRNATGVGTIGFQLYVAADSAGTLDSATAFAVGTSETAVSGTNVGLLTISGGLTPGVLDLLAGEQVWIRLVAKGTNNDPDPLNTVTGRMVLTALVLRVVFQDKIL